MAAGGWGGGESTRGLGYEEGLVGSAPRVKENEEQLGSVSREEQTVVGLLMWIFFGGGGKSRSLGGALRIVAPHLRDTKTSRTCFVTGLGVRDAYRAVRDARRVNEREREFERGAEGVASS